MTPKRGQNQASAKERSIRAAKARRKKQIQQAYREHTPPQVREARRSVRRTGEMFVPWERPQHECVCGKTFGSVRWLRKHQAEKCGGAR